MEPMLLSYRNFRAFKKAALEDPSFKKSLLAFGKPSETLENIKMSSATCVIDPDWINMIEAKLPFLINAVAEERQFVRSEGEILPIERVRNISKESIEDLGKHANYLTHDPATTGGKVIPDRLLISKKESDFKVYENRFLYACLLYLSQFLEVRLNEIVAVSGRYEGNNDYKKKYVSPTGSLEVEMHLHEIRLNDPVAANRGGSAEAVRKISSFLATTRLLLGTPLMKDVSTAPLVKAPITKTNVIRFDTNFRESLELYSFLHSYDKKGYEIKIEETSINPFKGRLKEDMFLTIFMDSYITYVYGNEIENELHLQNEEQEKKEKEAALEEYRKKLAKARRDMDSNPEGPEAYIALIEEGERILEKTIADKEDEITSLKENQRQQIISMRQTFDEGLASQQAEYDAFMKEKNEEIERVKQEAAEAVAKAEEEARTALEKAREQAQAELEAMKVQANEEIERAKQQAKQESNKAKEELARQKQELDSLVADTNAKMDENNHQMDELRKEMEEVRELAAVNEAKVISLLSQSGKSDFEAMTTKEKFAYLDAQKAAFDKYYKKQWALTKAAIRKEILSAPDPKAKKNRKAKDEIKEEGGEEVK